MLKSTLFIREGAGFVKIVKKEKVMSVAIKSMDLVVINIQFIIRNIL